MADRFIQLLCMSCNVCMILHVCSIQGIVCDVPDDVVYTDQHRNVRIGDSVALTCQFHGTPLAVYWRKLDDPTRVTTLVSWLKGDAVTGLCVGERPCEIMEMNEDYSLVIKKVSIAEQGRYICKVANYKGILIQNVTEISVFSPPKKPYPVINECLMSPDIKSNQTCVISTAEDPINISCTVSGYFPNLDLFFLRNYQQIITIHSEETTIGDGKKKKSITIQASPSPVPNVCVASDIPGIGGRRVASVLVTMITASVDRSDSTLAVQIVVPIIGITVLVAVLLGAIIRWYIRQQEPVSYVELWKLVNEGDLAKVNDILSELTGNPERNVTKKVLYTRLCAWKEGSSVNVRLLYHAIRKLEFHDELEAIKDFRACTSDRVSDDDLAHICSHVRSCEDETVSRSMVNPILRALYFPDREGRGPIFSTCNSFEDDFQMMKRWKSDSMSEKIGYHSRSEEMSIQVTKDDEMTPMYLGSGEVHLKKITSPPNQVIRLCLALEEAGKTVDERHRPVYVQLAKTFFKIRDKYNSDLTDGVLEEFAPNVSDRQYQRLWNTLELPKNAARNEDEVSVTNARMLYPSLDNNKPRRRLRHTAERYNRHDVADVLILRDQSNIMPLMWPDLLAFEGDKQCLLKSVSNSNVFIPRDQKNISSLMGPDLLAFEGHEQRLQKSVFNGSYSRVGSPNRYGSQTCGMSTQPTSGIIQILIVRGDRKTLTMMVRPTDTVSHLKVKIRERLNIASFQYWLQFQGKILSDMSTLQSYGLQDSSTVHLHGRLRGGCSFSHNLA